MLVTTAAGVLSVRFCSEARSFVCAKISSAIVKFTNAFLTHWE
jgi:hypothetical protein